MYLIPCAVEMADVSTMRYIFEDFFVFSSFVKVSKFLEYEKGGFSNPSVARLLATKFNS